MNTTTKIFVALAALILAVFAGGIGKMIGKSTADRFAEGKIEGMVDSTLMNIASEINKNLPMMLDAGTRIDSVVGIHKTMRYNYTLLEYSAEEVNASALKQATKKKLINNVCTTQEMEIFIDNNIPVAYAYYGKHGKQITIITILPSYCDEI